jgi:hypothetical protein
VPYRISGPLSSVQVLTGDAATVSVVGVRHQAKLEPPLKNLENQGNQDIITTIAEFTIHGRTVQGGVLEARGSLQVSFADFADQ